MTSVRKRPMPGDTMRLLSRFLAAVKKEDPIDPVIFNGPMFRVQYVDGTRFVILHHEMRAKLAGAGLLPWRPAARTQ